MFANCVHATSAVCSSVHFSERDFLRPDIASLSKNATETVRFLKTFKVWVFFEKKDAFFEKKLIFFKIAKGGKFAIESVSNGIISLKCLSRPNYEVFFGKN